MKRIAIIIIATLVAINLKAQIGVRVLTPIYPVKETSEFFTGVAVSFLFPLTYADSIQHEVFWKRISSNTWKQFGDPRFKTIEERKLHSQYDVVYVNEMIAGFDSIISNPTPYKVGMLIGVLLSPDLIDFKAKQVKNALRVTKVQYELKDIILIIDFKGSFWTKIERDHASLQALKRHKSMFLLPDESYISSVILGFKSHYHAPRFNPKHNRYQLIGRVEGVDRDYKLVITNYRKVSVRDGKDVYKAEAFNLYPLDNLKPFNIKK